MSASIYSESSTALSGGRVRAETTVRADETSWAAHEILGSWILRHRQLEQTARRATEQEKARIRNELSVCKKHIRDAIEEQAAAGPLALPADFDGNCWSDAQTITRLCSPNLFNGIEPKLLGTAKDSVALPAPKSASEPVLPLSPGPKSPSRSPMRPIGAVVSPPYTPLGATAMANFKAYASTTDLPDSLTDDDELVEWAEAMGVFADIDPAAAHPRANSDPGYPQMDNSAASVNRKRRLLDEAIRRARGLTRALYVTIDLHDRSLQPPPSQRVSGIRALGVIESEFGPTTGYKRLEIASEDFDDEFGGRLWLRRGAGPPPPICTNVRKPGTLRTIKPTDPPAPPRERVSVASRLRPDKKLPSLAAKVRHLMTRG